MSGDKGCEASPIDWPSMFGLQESRRIVHAQINYGYYCELPVFGKFSTKLGVWLNTDISVTMYIYSAFYVSICLPICMRK